MQEMITYFIIAATVLYIGVKVVRVFTSKKAVSSCATGGCSGCDVKNNCGTV